MEKQIIGLVKQNESIYKSLKTKNVENLGDLVVLDSTLSLEKQIELLLQENTRLKELVKLSKPPDEPKAPKIQPSAQPKAKAKPSPDAGSDDEDWGGDKFEPPAPKFTTIGNMEDLKRAFFSGEYTQFEELCQAIPYKFYKGNYNFASDKDGAPEFAARNLIKGFTRSFDDYRKYFMICFRCMQTLGTELNPTYTYPSLWIINTTDPIANIIGSTYEDFDLFEIINQKDIIEFLLSIRKIDESTIGLIGEGYVH